jgi:hypothetical protein
MASFQQNEFCVIVFNMQRIAPCGLKADFPLSSDEFFVHLFCSPFESPIEYMQLIMLDETAD